ncbi:hypothetical protein D9M69_425730 [compost metagenome]
MSHIRRIAYHDIEYRFGVVLGTRHTKHPFHVEEVGKAVLVEGVPACHAFGIACGHETITLEQGHQFFVQLLHLFFAALLSGASARGEIGGISVAQFGLFLGNGRIVQQGTLYTVARHAKQGIGGDDLGFEVGQRGDVPVRLAAVNRLADDERDKKAQLGYLHGDGLDVRAEDALFDQIELAGVVGVGRVGKVLLVFIQRSFRVVDFYVALNRVWGFLCQCQALLQRGKVLFAPALIVRIQLFQCHEQLGQHTHRKSTGAAGWV